MIRRPTPLLLLLALSLSPALAGDDGPPGDPAAFARYAVDAAREKRTGAAPSLRAWIAARARSKDRLVVFARLVGLDALITLRAKLPGEELAARLGEDEPVANAAAVLAVRYGDDAALLAAFDAADSSKARVSDAVWLALGNRLVECRAAGAAARFLGRLTVRLVVFVDDEPREATVRDPVPPPAVADWFDEVPEGFPPVPIWRLSEDRDSRGPERLVDGPRPVFVQRSVHDDELRYGYFPGGVPRDEARLEWIDALRGSTREERPLERVTARSVVFVSGADLLAKVRSARDDVASRFGTLAAKLLTAEERKTVSPRIETTLVDRRGKREPPLPALPEEWRR